ncbi:unnamed protein product [Cylindrotheca closterium]|uniref:Uncharacterized protein n=1 Tax=Cylindrotheca closterium TaxID=2856 RepID=A0AAD2FL85_9STRA|nr:unnamed protein product [Cylindrotheca closterium]
MEGLFSCSCCSDGTVSTEVTTCGPPLALKLSIHCPLPHTGTESALFLNGQDAALIRASSIPDATGQVVLHMANSQNVEWKAGSLAAVARMEEAGDAVASTEVMNCGPPIALKLLQNVSFAIMMDQERSKEKEVAIQSHPTILRGILRIMDWSERWFYKKTILPSIDGPSGLTLNGNEQDIVLEASSSPVLETVRLTFPTITIFQ